MRNRNWDQDFEQINQANVNRVHVNRDGQRQYDSGYRNNMGMSSFEQNMHDRAYQERNNRNWQQPMQTHNYGNAPSHRQARNNYNNHDFDRRPQQHDDRSFFNRFGERVNEFWHEGRERVEHLFDRFGNRQYNQGRDENRGYNQPDYYRQNQERTYHDERQNRYPNRRPQEGFESSPYAQGNQGYVQGNRYQPTDYSARSSYRLLDTYSGYGQSGGSYASDRDED